MRDAPKERLSFAGYNLVMFLRFLLTLCFLFCLTACGPAALTELPTLVRIPDTSTPTTPPTLVSATVSSLPTLQLASPTQPEASPTAISTSELGPTATLLPIPTLNLPPTLAATAIPLPSSDSAIIQFLGPGPLSKIVSPIKVYGYAVPGHDNKASLDLYGEDGHLVASKLLQIYTPYKWASFSVEMSFDLNSIGELGRLTLSTQDDYGRVNAVNSVHLLLLSEGTSIINQPGDLRERCVISQPIAGQRLFGGVLTVSGKIRPFNNLPLTLELIGRDGNVIGTQVIAINTPSNNDDVPFRVDIRYNIPSPEWALLSVRQNDDRIGGLMYLFSQEIFLNP
jgi:hypothetical protein